VLELGEDLFDRIEVGTVGRQEQKACAPGPDRSPDGGSLVAGQVVEDDDVAGREGGTELFLDPCGEASGIDRLVEDEGGIDPVAAQRGDEGHGLPVTIRDLGMEPLTFGRPASQRGHVGFGPSLVHEDQAPGVRPRLVLLPLLAPPGDLWPQLLGG